LPVESYQDPYIVSGSILRRIHRPRNLKGHHEKVIARLLDHFDCRFPDRWDRLGFTGSLEVLRTASHRPLHRSVSGSLEVLRTASHRPLHQIINHERLYPPLADSVPNALPWAGLHCHVPNGPRRGGIRHGDISNLFSKQHHVIGRDSLDQQRHVIGI